MNMPNERVNHRRRGKVGVLITFLIIAAFVLSLVLTSGIFFKVREIRVEGVYAVSASEVTELSGYLPGDNMFLINKAAAARSITSRMPYVRNVRIRRDWPGRVVIVITESAPAAAAEHRGVYWLFDAQGRLLETARIFELPGIPVVNGFTLLDPMIGTKIYPGVEDTAKLDPLLNLLREMQSQDIWHEVSDIDISHLSNIVFNYAGQYRVELGSPEAVQKKLQVLSLALEQAEIAERGPGTFYLAEAAEDRPVRFVPDS
jgi:cell division septal protein FtsQ